MIFRPSNIAAPRDAYRCYLVTDDEGRTLGWVCSVPESYAIGGCGGSIVDTVRWRYLRRDRSGEWSTRHFLKRKDAAEALLKVYA